MTLLETIFELDHPYVVRLNSAEALELLADSRMHGLRGCDLEDFRILTRGGAVKFELRPDSKLKPTAAEIHACLEAIP